MVLEVGPVISIVEVDIEKNRFAHVHVREVCICKVGVRWSTRPKSRSSRSCPERLRPPQSSIREVRAGTEQEGPLLRTPVVKLNSIRSHIERNLSWFLITWLEEDIVKSVFIASTIRTWQVVLLWIWPEEKPLFAYAFIVHQLLYRDRLLPIGTFVPIDRTKVCRLSPPCSSASAISGTLVAMD